MSPYPSEGRLITDTREVAVSETWDTQSDWDASPERRNVEVVDGSIQLIDSETVDNFEDADATPAGPYESGEDLSTYYSGDLEGKRRTTSNVTQGGHAIEGESPNNVDSFVVSHPGDGLPRYPEPQDTVGFLARDTTDNVWAGFVFCAELSSGTLDCYGAVIAPGNDDITLYRWEGVDPTDGAGGRLSLASENVSLDADTWYWCEVDIPPSSGSNEGDIEFRVYDFDDTDNIRGSQLATTSATDTNYTSNRGVGAYTGVSGGTVSFLDWIWVIG